jgi:hypothetical protein
MTIFVQVQEGDGANGPEPDRFKPWLNCRDRKSTVELAASKWIRERGGIRTGERPFTFTVHTYFDTDPVWPNNRPQHVLSTTLICYPNE